MKTCCFLYFLFVTISIIDQDSIHTIFSLSSFMVFQFSFLISNVSLEWSSLILMLVPLVSGFLKESFVCLSNLRTWSLLFFFLLFCLLPTLYTLFTLIFGNCSFSSKKFCKITSVYSHVSFSTSSKYRNLQIITTKSVFEIPQSLTKLVIIVPKLINFFFVFFVLCS